MKEITVRKPGSIRLVSGERTPVGHLRRVAFLILPAVLVLSMPTVASASAGSRNSEALGARPTAVDASIAAARPTTMAAAAVPTNRIVNGSNGAVGLGVIHLRDGRYTHGTYDAVLPSHTDTYDYFDTYGYFSWTGTAGWYTGAGYCTQQFRNDDGGTLFTRQLPDLHAGQHFIGSTTSYVVYAYHC